MTTLTERFWAKVRKTDTCWIWTAARNPKGYGIFQTGMARGTMQAHRLSYALKNGPFGMDGLIVRHSCDNPSCVNPDHLSLGTAQDNSDDMVRRGRSRRGGARPDAKLSVSDVQEIYDLYATGLHTQQSIANRFGINHSTVSEIWIGRKRSHFLDRHAHH